MGFRFSAGCCCCTHYYFHVTSSSRLQAVSNYGTYPNNRVVLGDSINSVNRFVIDWYNKLVFHSDSTTSKRIFQNTLTLSQPEFLATFDAPVTGTRQMGGMACDWLNRKIYYSTLKSTTGGTPPAQTHQFRRVDYDGTNDTELFTQTWDATSSAAISQTRIRVVPQLDKIFFWVTSRCGVVTGTPRQNNLTIRLYTCDLNGGGVTQLYEQEDSSAIDRRYSLHGFDVLKNKSKLIWAQFKDSFSAGITKEMRVFETDLDATGSVTILSRDTPAADTSEVEGVPAYSEKTEDVYYLGQRAPTSLGAIRFKLKKFNQADAIDVTGDSHEVELDGTQSNLITGAISPLLELQLGCALEEASQRFEGAT